MIAKTAGSPWHEMTAVVTGATSGIGEYVAGHLAATARTLIVQGPEPESEVTDLLDGFRRHGAQVHYVAADFSELSQVRAAAESILDVASRIDLLVNNAGTAGAPDRTVTVDGHERTLQVNHLAMTLLTVLLRPGLQRGSRIVNVGSGTHRYESIDLDDPKFTHGYGATSAYYRSKFAVVASSLWFADQLRPEGIDVITACPGVTDTGLIDAMFGRMGAPVRHGGNNILNAALVPLPTGTYIQDGEIQEPGADARRVLTQTELMRYTGTAVGLPGLETGIYLNVATP